MVEGIGVEEEEDEEGKVVHKEEDEGSVLHDRAVERKGA